MSDPEPQGGTLPRLAGPDQKPGAAAITRLSADQFRARMRNGGRSGRRRELIDGHMIVRPEVSSLHERARLRLTNLVSQRLPDGLIAVEDTLLILSDDTVLRPDVIAFPRKLISPLVRGPDLAFAVEIVSEPGDRSANVHASHYAKHHARELFVLDLRAGAVSHYFDLEGGQFRRRVAVDPGSPAVSETASGVSFTVAEVVRSI